MPFVLYYLSGNPLQESSMAFSTELEAARWALKNKDRLGIANASIREY